VLLLRPLSSWACWRWCRVFRFPKLPPKEAQLCFGSIATVRLQGEGGGSSSPGCSTAMVSAGGVCKIATRLALRSKLASSRELSMVVRRLPPEWQIFEGAIFLGS